MKLLDALLFEQAGRCFFCNKPLAKEHASVEHLVAKKHAGSSSNDNVVACCKQFNAFLGSRPLKEKIRIVISQPRPFKCPG